MTSFDMVRTLLEVSVRGGLALAFAGLMTIAMRRRSGALRHALWLAGLLCLLVAPTTLLLPRIAIPLLPSRPFPEVASPNASAIGQEIAVLSVESVRGQRSRSTRGLDTDDLLVALWLVGCAIMALRAARSHRYVGSLVREARLPSDPRLGREWRIAVAMTGAQAECRISRRVKVPLACGWRRPVVLLPEQAIAWSTADLRAVLVHELSHLSRRDPVGLAVAHLARALYWFHPLVWLATRELREESERACDDAVIRAGARPSSYAETLLAFAAGPTPEPAAAFSFLRRGGLEERITGILAADRDRKRLGRGERWMVGVLGVAAALLLAVAQPVPTDASAPRTPRASGVDSSIEPEAWMSRALEVEPSSAHFRNDSRSPVRIRYAEVRNVPDVDGMVGVTMPDLALENRDATRRVASVQLALDLPTTRDRSWVSVSIAPASSARLRLEGREWAAVVPASHAQRLTLHVVGVLFASGDSWDAQEVKPVLPRTPKAAVAPEPATPPAPAMRLETPAAPEPATAPEPMTPSVPPTPPSRRGTAPRADEWPAPRPEVRPDARPAVPSAPQAPRPETRPSARPDITGWVPALVRNPRGAPVILLEARTPRHEGVAEGERSLTWLPQVVIENRSDRRVVALRLRYKAESEGHGVSGYRVSIAPHATAVVQRKDFEIGGRAEDMTVQILGARFDDGSVWGTMDSTIDARDPWVYPLSDADR